MSPAGVDSGHQIIDDTICAIATPPGRGGVGIVRVSGSTVEAIAQALIDGLPEARRAALVTVRDAGGRAIDHGLALSFPAPHSFTGEHVLELQLHGSPVVLEQVMAACVAAGARRAGPGEFSQRAFLNDKLDLVQAEAIADLIDATSEQSARAARRSLDGKFSEAVHALVESTTRVRVHVEAALDFPDEDIDFLADGEVARATAGCIAEASELLKRARTGRLVGSGVRLAIVGRPNAGKSSLFNALVQRDAAIVTDVPGTTRDVVRETVHFGGIPAVLADTAGLRDTQDTIEREGVRRARAEMAEADLVLWVTDVTESRSETPPAAPVPMIRIHNKIDQTDALPRRDGLEVWLSARTGVGLVELDGLIAEVLGMDEGGECEYSARTRHVEQIRIALDHIQAGHDQLLDTGSGELLAEELKLAAEALGEITGRIHSDELLGRIFSSFCIGK